MGDSLCVGDSLELGTEEEAIAYSWTGPNGFFAQERNPRIAGIQKSEEGWYRVEAEYLFGCKGIDSVYVQVNAPELEILQGDSVNICLGGQIGLEGRGQGNLLWDLNSPGILSQNGNQLIVSPQIISTYTLLATDVLGCTTEVSTTVSPQAFELDLLGKAPTCPGLSDGSISASLSGGQAPFEIRMLGSIWNMGTEISSVLPGNYQIEVRDAVGCIAHGSLVVEGAEPVSAALGINPPSCVGSCDGELSLIPLEGQAPFSFFLENEEKDSLIAGLCAEQYSVSVRDARGCIWSERAEIENPEAFEIDLGRDKKVREGKSLVLELESNDRLAQIRWPGLCEENCSQSLEISPDSSQWYYAYAENLWGCQAEDSVFVRVKKKAECLDGIYAPNAFSPNGDGLNERFTLYADPEETDVAHLSQLIIFNKWGKVIWSKSSMPFNAPELGWDGYAKGKKVPEGTYTWAGSFLREDGLSFSCGGNITLIR